MIPDEGEPSMSAPVSMAAPVQVHMYVVHSRHLNIAATPAAWCLAENDECLWKAYLICY